MCTDLKKLAPMADGYDKQSAAAVLLDLAASNDLAAFKRAVEEDGCPLNASAPWYTRSPGRGEMDYQQRTPLMIAALYGSTTVIDYILASCPAAAAWHAASDEVTALHCAAASGSPTSLDSAKLLISASPDLVDALDASGNRPGDVIARQISNSDVKSLQVILKAPPSSPRVLSPRKEESIRQGEKKEYPLDLTLPDIKTGIYGTDEFRMYTFKIKPCSRAYSHDWTECPFVHPGENARRRDPRKYSYTCVPCPEYKKGSCGNGDACEYAHGVFESWLHPVQYRTRLCKDETGCNRRVCFFAHKLEELRTVNQSAASVAGTVLPSPRSSSPGFSSLDMATALMLMQQPGSPISPSSSSGVGDIAAWMSQTGGVMTPPTLQLPSSRLKAWLSARDLNFELELLGLEGYQQKLIDEISASPRGNWGSTNMSSASRATECNNLLGTVDPLPLTELQGLIQTEPHFQTHMHYGYESSLSSSPPVNTTLSFGLDHSMAKAIMNSRISAIAKRSQSFCDRSAPIGRQSSSPAMPTAPSTTPSNFSDWGSWDGKLDWGIQGEDLNKLKKFSSFTFGSNQPSIGVSSHAAASIGTDEPDLSWVQSLVKDGPSAPVGHREQQNGYQLSDGGDLFYPWAEEKIMA